MDHGGFFEITSTRVIPSPRISERVPFGTGRAMLKMSELNSAHFVTYSLDSIQAVGVLFGLVERLYHHKELAQLEILLHPSLQQYLHDIDWVDAVREVQANASTLENFMAFLMECYQRGILNKERTGGLELTWGNTAAAYEVIHQLARNEGFGKLAGMGIRKLKKYFVEHFGADEKLLNDIGMENKGLEYSQYVSKESLAQQGGYAMTNKGPQHDEAWLIFMVTKCGF